VSPVPAYRAIETDQGELRIYPARASRPTATLVLHHGAGGGIESPDLVALAARLPRLGISVFRVEQPWRVAGRRVAAPPARLDEAALAAANAIRVRTPVIWGGRSAGARVACRMARQLGAVGVLALAFPLHPPGRPEKSRLDELLGTGVPTLVVQGERDPFGAPTEFPPEVDLATVPAGDHSFAVPRRAAVSTEDALGIVVEAVVEWVTSRVA
jgi:predicted alpha/beta-hydrolase family hydrolase